MITIYQHEKKKKSTKKGVYVAYSNYLVYRDFNSVIKFIFSLYTYCNHFIFSRFSLYFVCPSPVSDKLHQFTRPIDIRLSTIYSIFFFYFTTKIFKTLQDICFP